MYRDFLVARDWAVTGARDGRDALVLALKERPSIVITELWLPFIDGVALCRLLRQDPTTNAVAILVVTSEVRATHLKCAEQAGANAVLVKPTTPDIVAAAMDRLTAGTSAPSVRQPVRTPRRSLAKAHYRFETTTPNVPPPELFCPICAAPLKYDKTFIGGVSRLQPERWDYLNCVRCGPFSYRHRTRKLRQIVA